MMMAKTNARRRSDRAFTTKQHGFWQPYRPDKRPEGLPLATMFCRRQGDGIDWYEFLKTDQLASDSVKMTINIQASNRQHIVQAATYDANALFPQNCLLVEVAGITDTNPQDRYGGKEFDPVSQTFNEPPEQMPPISNRQFYQALAMRRLISQQEALAAVRSGDLPRQLQDVVDNLPSEQQFPAQMWWSGTSLHERNHFLIERFSAALGMNNDELDELWRYAATL